MRAREIPIASVELLASAVTEIEQAVGRPQAGDRYVSGHRGARRAAAAVLAARARPDRRGTPRDVWAVLPTVAPELTEWARFFAAGTGKRVAVEAGFSQVVSVREADDLVRDAHNFLTVVVGLLVPAVARPATR
ncbi:MAG: SAV_6107 family HEPN domain-containing protein [Candidatus Nanopelagicales bacterium]